MTTNKDIFTLQPNAEVFFADLLDEIKKAKHSFAAQFYTFEADTTGLPIAKALMDAYARGVKVRFMVDHYINLSHSDYVIKQPRFNRQLQRDIMAEWRATNQLLDTMRARGIGIKMTNPLGFLQRNMLHRDHKKLVVIDEKIGYIGGINIADHHMVWNDFMVKTSGEIVKLIQAELDHTWHGNSKAHSTNFNGGTFITDIRGDARILPFACSLIAKATQKVIVESPYLWGSGIYSALEKAAERGVKVSVIVPLNVNWPVFVPTTRLLNRLVRAGVQVYRFKEGGGMTHAKALIVDDTALFGSSNFNEFLSGKISEANVVTKDISFVKQLEAFLTNDMVKSTH